MEEAEVKHVLEAALLAAGRPLPVEKLLQLFASKGPEVDRSLIRSSLESLAADYEGRGLQVKEVASGYRIQIRSSMTDWLEPLWEERAPRYTRALLETLALIAYRQPITRGEIEQVRGVAVSTNIVRTLLERGWIRVVGHRDVPGRPEMFGTTRTFLDYFGLKSLDELPPLAEIRDGLPEISPQTDFLETLADAVAANELAADSASVSFLESQIVDEPVAARAALDADADSDVDAGEDSLVDAVTAGRLSDAEDDAATEPD